MNSVSRSNKDCYWNSDHICFPGQGNKYDLSSNNNLYYCGTPSSSNVIWMNDVATYSTLANLKSVAGQMEQNSVTENPPFISVIPGALGYLAPNTSSVTQIEGGATPLAGFTVDYYGNSRDINFPDIGAIEGSYIASATDTNAPVFSAASFVNTSC